jgi:GT2 family glycosyltransferase
VEGVGEIVIVSNIAITKPPTLRDSRVRFLVAPNLSISEARNLGIASSTGEVIAFTDDDCVVDGHWVSSAIPLFEDPNVAVVGGPGITHPTDTPLCKCAGAALESIAGTYSSSSRYASRGSGIREAGEQNLSTCNIFLRRSTLQTVGYFDRTIYPCEENELIWRIKARGYRVLYVPNCIVFHHRRPIIRPFLSQISSYAKGRATLTRKYPRSLRLTTVASCMLVLMILALPFTYLTTKTIFYILATVMVAYLAITFSASLRSCITGRLSPRYQPLVWLTILLMHLCYGGAFLVTLARNSIRPRGIGPTFPFSNNPPAPATP